MAKTLTPESLLACCPELKAAIAQGCRISVALSGGCDSLVLLHLIARLFPDRGGAGKLRAIHINHRLQPEAASWESFCRRSCRALGVPLSVARLDGEALKADKNGSLENAARQARYEIFGKKLGVGELLLQGHHADDQMETMLFRLVRGSGPLGLAGIPAERPVGKGRLLRPLLSWSRQDIEDCARAMALEWIEDPSNASTDFDRNYLRHEILPRLVHRWPGARNGFSRSRQLLVDADECGGHLAALDRAQSITETGMLRTESLLALSPARQRNLLQRFLSDDCSRRGVAPPDHVSLQRILDEVLAAGPSANPVVRWPRGKPGTEVRRYDGLLHVLPALQAVPADRQWSGRGTLKPGAGTGSLRLRKAGPGGFYWSGEPLTVRFDVTGLRIALPGRPARTLRRLCQELRIPPWQRERLPLLFSGDTLLSVADIAVPDQAGRERGAECYQLVWNRQDLR